MTATLPPPPPPPAAPPAPPPPATRPPRAAEAPRRLHAAWCEWYDVEAQMPGGDTRVLGVCDAGDAGSVLRAALLDQASGVLPAGGMVVFTDARGRPAGPSRHLLRDEPPPDADALEAQMLCCAQDLASHPGRPARCVAALLRLLRPDELRAAARHLPRQAREVLAGALDALSAHG